MRYFPLIRLAKVVENVNIQYWQSMTTFPVTIKIVKIKGPSCSLALILTLPLTHCVT